ncbi:MAG: PIN domain-containing protein [Xanthobacteraceae bacterium]|nr:PIN domain-containing protein [Xanthobacteraceae bacterium]
MTVAIVDTGPLVALFDRAEQHHRWVVERFEELDAPLLVCEPVLAEAMYLLARLSESAGRRLGAHPGWSIKPGIPDRRAHRGVAQIASEIQRHADVAS